MCRSSVSIVTTIHSRVNLWLHSCLTQITATNVIKVVVSCRTVIAYDDTGDIVVVLRNWAAIMTEYVAFRVIHYHGGGSFL